MKIVVAKDYEEASTIAFDIIKNILLEEPAPVLGLATGSTPLGLYAKMAEACAKKVISFRNTRTANLDEYVGLAPSHPQSYRYFMESNLFSRIDLPRENAHLPDGTAPDLQEECRRYDALLERMPRDIQLLGIGNNGHIAFNEPGTPFDCGTHIVRLDPSTIEANARFFSSEKEVPRKAITMGIKGIMSAKKILLVAMGTKKANAIAQALQGEIHESCPASVLQRHPDVVVVLDKEASAKLRF
jgi:glucosamine-6-phosphate deaminase